MSSIQVNNIAENVFELKGDARQGLVTAVEVVGSCTAFVVDDLTKASGNGYLFDDVSVARHAHSVEVAESGARQVDVTERVHVNEARPENLAAFERVGSEIFE